MKGLAGFCVFVTLAIGWTPAVHAQPAAAIAGACVRFSAAIELSERNLSYYTAKNFTEDSAPRASMNDLEKANLLAAIRTNIELMVQHHCPPIQHAITDDRYLESAMACRRAEIENSTEQGAVCARGSWKAAP